MRVVFDTRHTVVLSEHILDELRKHLSGKRKLTGAQVDAAIKALARVVEIVVPASVPTNACRDADDLPVIGTALAADAAALVTGDDDLLVIRQYQRIEISHAPWVLRSVSCRATALTVPRSRPSRFSPNSR